MMAVPDELVLRTRKLIERFREIKYYSSNFTLSENDGERRRVPDIGTLRKSSSVVSEKSILGREYDKCKIVEELLSEESCSPVSVLAIVGMGGLGKTTLAQLVYNDTEVNKAFELQAWVCVSDKFDIISITRSIVTAVTKENCDQADLCILQESLVKEIMEKKVLLVLDDVWNERRDCWDLLCMPMNRAKLCTIIVTTRSERVARLVQTMPFYSPNCLYFHDSWLLFKQVAFTVDQGNSPNLKQIGKGIVGKCNGLPLAIKTLGSMLRYETNEQRWKDVLESELWDMEQARNEVLPSLELSYKHMPIYLKRCFVSLSLYPKDYRLNKREVLQLWKLLDLLQSDQHDIDNEIGTTYLNELVERSFLQEYFQFTLDDTQHVMHDLIHDLACFLSADEFFRLHGDTSIKIPHNARYISIQDCASAEISVAPVSLRAIIVLPGEMVHIKNPEALFSNCEKLRVLVLDKYCLGQLVPAFIVRLKLLRHLKVGFFFNYFDSVEGLYEIGHLINLRSLHPFQFSHIIEMRGLNEIRELAINGLRKGTKLNIDDAKDAQFQRKRHLQFLCVEFDSGSEEEDEILCVSPIQSRDMQLLENMRPYHSLRELIINGYASPMYPCWLGYSSFVNLTKIEIDNSESLYLPTLGDLPSLVSLCFYGMWLVQRVGREFCSHVPGAKGFPSLLELRFDNMPNWLEWSGVGHGDFPCLHTLSISNANSLRSLPSVPFMSLKTLILRNCPCMAFPVLPRSCILHIGWGPSS